MCIFSIHCIFNIRSYGFAQQLLAAQNYNALHKIAIALNGNILVAPVALKGDKMASGIKEYPLSYEETNSDLEGEDRHKFMEFRLIYEGQLKAQNSGNSRVIEKHDIRRKLHPQLKTLWTEHPALEYYRDHIDKAPGLDSEQKTEIFRLMRQWSVPEGQELTYENFLAANFSKCGFNFVPLVHAKLDLICSLDILFLRRSNPGDLVRHGGDLDNRIKTLFDALKVPDECSEIPQPPQADETPFYCLLQDDALITKVNITTDKLMTPMKDGAHPDDVLLIMNVKVSATRMWLSNLQISS